MELAKRQTDWAFGYQDETWWSRYACPSCTVGLKMGQFLKLVEQANDKTQLAGKKALVMIWDNATWHKSLAVRTWIREQGCKEVAIGHPMIDLLASDEKSLAESD